MATTARDGSAAPPLDDTVTGSLVEWHALRTTIESHPLVAAPGPTLFTDTPAVMIGHINRAYYRGGTAFRTNDPNIELLTPQPRSSDCATSIWALHYRTTNELHGMLLLLPLPLPPRLPRRTVLLRSAIRKPTLVTVNSFANS